MSRLRPPAPEGGRLGRRPDRRAVPDHRRPDRHRRQEAPPAAAASRRLRPRVPSRVCRSPSSRPSGSTRSPARACSRRRTTRSCSTSRSRTRRTARGSSRTTGTPASSADEPRLASRRPTCCGRATASGKGIDDDAVAEGLLLPFNRALRNPDGSVKEPRYYQRTAINRSVEAILQRRQAAAAHDGDGHGQDVRVDADRLEAVEERVAARPQPAHPLPRRPQHPRRPADRARVQAGVRHWRGLADLEAPAARRSAGARSTSGCTSSSPTAATDLNGMFREFAPDFFDLVIVDECHRGSARAESSWRAILEHFSPATQLGMTATPKRDETADTYDYFGGSPLFEYSLAAGHRRRLPRALPGPAGRAQPRRPRLGARPGPARPVRQGDPRRASTPRKDFERVVSLLTRTEAAAKHLTDYLKRTDRMAKTIVFCVNQEHADQMRRALHNANADLAKQHPNYVVRIVSDEGEIGQRPPQRLRRHRDGPPGDRHHVGDALDRRRPADGAQHRPLPASRLDGAVQADDRPRHSAVPRRGQALLRHHRLLRRDRTLQRSGVRRPAGAGRSTRRSTTKATSSRTPWSRSPNPASTPRAADDWRGNRSRRPRRGAVARSSTSTTPRCGSRPRRLPPRPRDRAPAARRVPRLRDRDRSVALPRRRRLRSQVGQPSRPAGRARRARRARHRPGRAASSGRVSSTPTRSTSSSTSPGTSRSPHGPTAPAACARSTPTSSRRSSPPLARCSATCSTSTPSTASASSTTSASWRCRRCSSLGTPVEIASRFGSADAPDRRR